MPPDVCNPSRMLLSVGARTFHRNFAGVTRGEAEVAERCTITTRSVVRNTKLVGRDDRNIFQVLFRMMRGTKNV